MLLRIPQRIPELENSFGFGFGNQKHAFGLLKIIFEWLGTWSSWIEFVIRRQSSYTEMTADGTVKNIILDKSLYLMTIK